MSEEYFCKCGYNLSDIPFIFFKKGVSEVKYKVCPRCETPNILTSDDWVGMFFSVCEIASLLCYRGRKDWDLVPNGEKKVRKMLKGEKL